MRSSRLSVSISMLPGWQTGRSSSMLRVPPTSGGLSAAAVMLPPALVLQQRLRLVRPLH
jgi:hypothetical protein